MKSKMRISLDETGRGSVVIIDADGKETDISSHLSAVKVKTIETGVGCATRVVLSVLNTSVEFEGMAEIFPELLDEKEALCLRKK